MRFIKNIKKKLKEPTQVFLDVNLIKLPNCYFLTEKKCKDFINLPLDTKDDDPLGTIHFIESNIVEVSIPIWSNKDGIKEMQRRVANRLKASNTNMICDAKLVRNNSIFFSGLELYGTFYRAPLDYDDNGNEEIDLEEQEEISKTK